MKVKIRSGLLSATSSIFHPNMQHPKFYTFSISSSRFHLYLLILSISFLRFHPYFFILDILTFPYNPPSFEALKLHPKQFHNARCPICAKNPQIMLQKTWSNFIFSTLHTCEGPKRCPKANVQIRIDLVYLPEYLIFVEISCLALPEKSYLLWFGKIR